MQRKKGMMRREWTVIHNESISLRNNLSLRYGYNKKKGVKKESKIKNKKNKRTEEKA